MATEIVFEDYVAPAAEPHEYAPIIEQLIAAGPDKIAAAIFDDEATAKRFVLEMQKAARQFDKSAVKRTFEPELDAKGKATGRVKAGVSVRAKITRAKAAPESTDAD